MEGRALGWLGCPAPLPDRSPNQVRHVAVLTFTRTGSSLVTARLAEAMYGNALPLFEMFSGWPFAMLTFYSQEPSP